MHSNIKFGTSAVLLSTLCLLTSKPAFAGDFEFDNHDFEEVSSRSSGGGLGTLEVIGISAGSAIIGGFVGHRIGRKKGYNEAMRDYSKYINQPQQNQDSTLPVQNHHNLAAPEPDLNKTQVDLDQCLTVKTGQEFCLVK